MATLEEESWHLDRRVPVALIIALLAQGCIGIWWVSGLNTQVQDHERRIEKVEININKELELLRTVSERLARIEQAVLDIKTDISKK
jgi:hypothetical protein